MAPHLVGDSGILALFISYLKKTIYCLLFQSIEIKYHTQLIETQFQVIFCIILLYVLLRISKRRNNRKV